MSTHRPRVVIIGGGFAGLEAARAMRKGDVDVVLLDKRNYHVFQPLLYQVATAGLSPADIAAPLRAVLNRQPNTRVILGHARSIDRERRAVVLDCLGRNQDGEAVIELAAAAGVVGGDPVTPVADQAGHDGDLDTGRQFMSALETEFGTVCRLMEEALLA